MEVTRLGKGPCITRRRENPTGMEVRGGENEEQGGILICLREDLGFDPECRRRTPYKWEGTDHMIPTAHTVALPPLCPQVSCQSQAPHQLQP